MSPLADGYLYFAPPLAIFLKKTLVLVGGVEAWVEGSSMQERRIG